MQSRKRNLWEQVELLRKQTSNHVVPLTAPVGLLLKGSFLERRCWLCNFRWNARLNDFRKCFVWRVGLHPGKNCHGLLWKLDTQEIACQSHDSSQTTTLGSGLPSASLKIRKYWKFVESSCCCCCCCSNTQWEPGQKINEVGSTRASKRWRFMLTPKSWSRTVRTLGVFAN